METVLKKYRDIALSDREVLKIVKNRANLVLYSELINFKNIDEVLGFFGASFILFESKPHYGHWCLIFKRTPEIIEFFNPYGGFPDDSLEYIPYSFRVASNQLFPILSHLLDKSPYKLEYNEFQFQQKKKDVKTCGRWCGVRLVLRNLDIYEFKEVIDYLSRKLKLKPDDVVTVLTIYINK
jgi:hypothetical protein